MPVVDLCLTGSSGSGGAAGVRLGEPLLDAYLEFLAARCRPNTVLAAAFDLKVFFAVVGKPPGGGHAGGRARLRHRPARRRGHRRPRRGRRTAGGGVSARTVRRRLSSVSGLFAFLQARGDVAANPVPRGSADPPGAVPAAAGRAAGARAPDAAADPGARPGRRADRRAAHAPGPGDGRGDGARRAAPLRGPRAAAGRSAGRPSGGCSSPRARAGTNA